MENKKRRDTGKCEKDLFVARLLQTYLMSLIPYMYTVAHILKYGFDSLWLFTLSNQCLCLHQLLQLSQHSESHSFCRFVRKGNFSCYQMLHIYMYILLDKKINVTQVKYDVFLFFKAVTLNRRGGPRGRYTEF